MGAVANRISAKWHEQKGVLGVLNPFSWAEYIATGNYRNKDENGNTAYDAAPRRTVGSASDRKNIDAGDSSALQQTISQNVANIEVSQLENMVFRYWFITFDNGEVAKVLSYDEDGAKMSAKTLIDHPVMLKRLGAQISAYEQYKNVMDQQYTVYKAIFNDGQIFYTIGKSEEEASGTAKEIVKGLAKAFDESYKNNHINVQKYKVPNLERLEMQEKLEIPLPKTVENISNYASVPGKENDNEKESKFFWQYGTDLYQVEMTFSKGVPKDCFRMRFPTENFEMARKIVDDILSDFWNTSYGKMIRDDKDDTDNWYKARFADGDCYIVHGKNLEEMKQVALHLYLYKMKKCMRFIDSKYDKVLDAKREKVARIFLADSLSKVKDTAPDKPDKIIDLNNIMVEAVYKEYNEVKRRVEKTETVLEKSSFKP
jgi:hypothetical protein